MKSKINFLTFSKKDDRNFEIKEKKTKFGKRFFLKSPDGVNAIMNIYNPDESFEISILTSSGFTEYFTFYPNKNKNTLGILFCTNGEVSIFNANSNESYFIKKNEFLIYKRDSDILKNFFTSSKDVDNILIFLNLDNFEKYILKSINPEIFYKWKEKLDILVSESPFCYGVPNAKIKITANWLKNMSLNTLEDYIKFKEKSISFVFSILDIKLNPIQNKAINHNEIVQKIKNLINTYNVNEIPSINNLSKTLKLSTYHSQALFKKSENISLSQYINSLKMEHSLHLITHTNLSITEIAFEVGFQNPSKFSKAFKKYHNSLPREMIKKLRK